MTATSYALADAEPRSAAPAVVCRALTKAFGDGESRVWALRGVDMKVSGGEMTLLVGPSGCGKTTLISIIAGLLDPSDGAVSVLGEDLRRLRGSRLVGFRGDNIGFVFQQYNLLPALTAAENAAVPLIIQGRRRGDAVAFGGRAGLPARLAQRESEAGRAGRTANSWRRRLQFGWVAAILR